MPVSFEELINIAPFSLTLPEKSSLLIDILDELTHFHYKHCQEYKRVLDALNYKFDSSPQIQEIPFIPVKLFKEKELLSISKQNIFKTMTSSGTTGQKVSKIYLDKKTASNQQKVLVKIVSDFTESSRLPMIILDSPNVLKDRMMFSARGAGILGFSIFGSDRIYALDENMRFDAYAVEKFLNKYQGKPVLMFGFTFMVWQYFFRVLKNLPYKIDLSNAILIHGGGWKKLLNEAVSKQDFKDSLQEVSGIKKIHDYYGMVEQTGSLYMECQFGYLHSSIFSDIVIRKPSDFSVCENGEKGIIQVISVLPKSYPGHSLLTEDEGVVLGIDNCQCGRMGKYFHVLGRVKGAEIRGCSDTYRH